MTCVSVKNTGFWKYQYNVLHINGSVYTNVFEIHENI